MGRGVVQFLTIDAVDLSSTFFMLLINRSSMTYPIPVFISPINKPTINVNTI
jgi:hypothetical protein